MSKIVYTALTSFVLNDAGGATTTVKQGEKRAYYDDDLEYDLLQAGYISRFEPGRDVYGTSDLSYMFYQGNRLDVMAEIFTKAKKESLTGIDSAFAYCYYLEDLDVSELDVSEISNFNRVFLHCEALTELDLSTWNVQSLDSSEYIFAYTTNLTKLVINNSARVFDLSDANALEGSAIAGGTGFVYVPADMVNAYKAHAVWGLYPDQIKSIAELPA